MISMAVTEELGLDDIRHIINHRRLGLFGHVACLQSEVPVASALSACWAAASDG